jgi:hypothetical protein
MSRIDTFRPGLVVMAIAAALATFAPFASADLTNVDDASDVCPPTADPCIVTQAVEMVDGAVLDFGLRAIEVRLAGVLDAGAGTATVRCGNFVAVTGAATAISAAGPSGQDTIEGGSFTLEVVRACSGDTNVHCADPADCQLGTCSDGHCTGSPERSCSVDEECALGLCSVGSGDADINGAIDANARSAGAVAVHAAGDLILRQDVHANSAGPTFDGGSVDLASGHASVTVLGKIEAISGGNAQGGFVSISAAANVDVENTIDLTGGDFDGGFFAVEADGDVVVNADVLADAGGGEGSGGDVSIIAGNDLTVTEGRLVTANGSEARSGGFSGDGGTMELTAGHDLSCSPAQRSPPKARSRTARATSSRSPPAMTSCWMASSRRVRAASTARAAT